MNPKYLGDGSFFTSDGKVNATRAALNVELLDTRYSSFDFMVNNFASTQETMELVIAGYVVVDGEYQLLQAEYSLEKTPATSSVTRGNTSLYTVSLSSVRENHKITTLPDYIAPQQNDEE